MRQGLALMPAGKRDGQSRPVDPARNARTFLAAQCQEVAQVAKGRVTVAVGPIPRSSGCRAIRQGKEVVVAIGILV